MKAATGVATATEAAAALGATGKRSDGGDRSSSGGDRINGRNGPHER